MTPFQITTRRARVLLITAPSERDVGMTLVGDAFGPDDEASWFSAQETFRDPEQEAKNLGASLQVAISTITDLNEKLTSAHREIEDLSAELTEQSGSGGALKAELVEAQGVIASTRKALEEATRERDAATKSVAARDSLLKDVRAQRDALASEKVELVGELESMKQSMFEANRRAKHAISSLEAERKSNGPIAEEHRQAGELIC